MGKLILGLVIGLISGAALIFFFFVSVPTSAQPPGRPIQPPDATVAPGSAQIVLRQEFFNEVLTAIFRDLNDPAFPLSGQPNAGCDDTLKVLSEGSGAATAVRFENNRISAPLAFSGNYNSAIGCFPFSGWALGYLDLRYDAAAKSVFGQINVETVNLDGVNPILSGLITPLIQTTLNNRVNPIQILQGSQISVNAPIASAGGTLAANVEDVRAEVKDNALSLHVIYAFNGAPR